jgi:hypothetical protein
MRSRLTTRSTALAALVALAFVAYAFLLERHIGFAVGGADSSGYMSGARLLASGHLSVPVEPVRTLKLNDQFTELFVPIGWWPRPGARMVPAYPAGLSVHLALAAMIGGWNSGPYYVPWIAAIGSLVLLFGICRQLEVPRWLAVAASAALASLPIFMSSAIQPFSDEVALFWTLAVVWCALRAGRAEAWAVAAGAAFGAGVWVRPTSILMIVPLVVALRLRKRLLLYAAVGAAPFGAALMAFNYALFGGPFRTGYGTLREVVNWDALRNCPKFHFLEVIRTLTPIPLAGLVASLFDRSVERWVRLLLPVWFGVFVAFYSLWNVCQNWFDMRFILPGIPALLVATVLVMRDAVAALPRWASVVRVVTVVLMAIVCVSCVRAARRYDALGYDQSFWPKTVFWAERSIPRRAIVVSGIYGGAFYYYASRFTIRWDFLDDDKFQLLRAYAGNAGLPWYAVTSADADLKPEVFAKRYQARWRPISTYRDVTLWRLEE